MVVLAVDAMEVAVGEEDVDDGVEGWLFATVEADGGDFEVGGGTAETSTAGAIGTTSSRT